MQEYGGNIISLSIPDDIYFDGCKNLLKYHQSDVLQRINQVDHSNIQIQVHSDFVRSTNIELTDPKIDSKSQKTL
jgi:hypothetical protein